MTPQERDTTKDKVFVVSFYFAGEYISGLEKESEELKYDGTGVYL